MKFYATEAERDFIEKKMALMGAANMSVYLRRMAMEGYVLKLDLPELKECLSLMHRMSNNLNQIARHANTTGRLYREDLEDIRQQQEGIWDSLRGVLTKLERL